jgi:hypothetical protein
MAEEVIEDDHPSLHTLAAGCHKIMNAIDNKESLTRKEWMGHYEYVQPRPLALHSILENLCLFIQFRKIQLAISISIEATRNLAAIKRWAGTLLVD